MQVVNFEAPKIEQNKTNTFIDPELWGVKIFVEYKLQNTARYFLASVGCLILISSTN